MEKMEIINLKKLSMGSFIKLNVMAYLGLFLVFDVIFLIISVITGGATTNVDLFGYTPVGILGSLIFVLISLIAAPISACISAFFLALGLKFVMLFSRGVKIKGVIKDVKPVTAAEAPKAAD